MKGTVLWIALASLLASLPANAEKLRLVCKYEHTIESNGNDGPTSGQELVTVVYSNGGQAVIKLQSLGADFVGTVTDEEIAGDTQYKIENLSMRQTLTINRFTGDFTLAVSANEKPGLIHYGTCRSAKKQIF